MIVRWGRTDRTILVASTVAIVVGVTICTTVLVAVLFPGLRW